MKQCVAGIFVANWEQPGLQKHETPSSPSPEHLSFSHSPFSFRSKIKNDFGVKLGCSWTQGTAILTKAPTLTLLQLSLALAQTGAGAQKNKQHGQMPVRVFQVLLFNRHP